MSVLHARPMFDITEMVARCAFTIGDLATRHIACAESVAPHLAELSTRHRVCVHPSLCVKVKAAHTCLSLYLSGSVIQHTDFMLYPVHTLSCFRTLRKAWTDTSNCSQPQPLSTCGKGPTPCPAPAARLYVARLPERAPTGSIFIIIGALV